MTARKLDAAHLVVPFYRGAPDDVKRAAREPAGPGIRKIVLGTNLAETSITFNDFLYVVDGGLICEEQFNPSLGSVGLPSRHHSQAGCRQRAGRVGREAPGEAHHLYTRDDFRARPAYSVPAVQRVNSEPIVLQLVRAGVAPEPAALASALMDAPRQDEIRRALDVLALYQAVDTDGDVTWRGEELSRSPAPEIKTFRDVQLLCEADRFGVLLEMAIYVAFSGLSTEELPNRGGRVPLVWLPESSRTSGTTVDDARRRAAALAVGRLDDLELYVRLWQGWSAEPDPSRRRAWADARGVNHDALVDVERRLGLGDGRANGALDAFWTARELELMSRDIDLARLDLVRYLVYVFTPGQLCVRQPGKRPSGKSPQFTLGAGTAVLDQFSVWNADDTPKRLGLEITRTHCVGRPSGGQPTTLSHVVWIDSNWLVDPPTAGESPLGLALKFAAAADVVRAQMAASAFSSRGTRSGLSAVTSSSANKAAVTDSRPRHAPPATAGYNPADRRSEWRQGREFEATVRGEFDKAGLFRITVSGGGANWLARIPKREWGNAGGRVGIFLINAWSDDARHPMVSWKRWSDHTGGRSAGTSSR